MLNSKNDEKHDHISITNPTYNTITLQIAEYIK